MGPIKVDFMTPIIIGFIVGMVLVGSVTVLDRVLTKSPTTCESVFSE